ncbi:hypothetical protein I79_020490 [Cricetulus griseus]|uniref:Uncharacterized protein n=1 Tax=Cricetulus griseus TaxID=10029 RepID=G3IA74_CRIGR|nr:hypothetical protein I79_020490 [Cricetulus griseus]
MREELLSEALGAVESHPGLPRPCWQKTGVWSARPKQRLYVRVAGASSLHPSQTEEPRRVMRLSS